jgi:hypothetical protein
MSRRTDIKADFQHNGYHGVMVWRAEAATYVVADSSARAAFQVEEEGTWEQRIGAKARVWTVKDGLLLEV